MLRGSNVKAKDIKPLIGIPQSITVYDENIDFYIEDALEVMRDSGVPQYVLDEEGEQVKHAVACHVRAFVLDPTDVYKYDKMFRDRTFRLTLKEGE